MDSSPFHALFLSEWRPTRDALHAYCRVLGKIRRSLTPTHKHWWHASLRVLPHGISSAPIAIPGRPEDSFELWMDLETHRLSIRASRGETWSTELAGLSTHQFLDSCLSTLERFGVQPEVDRSLFQDHRPLAYDPAAATNFWKALSRINGILQDFKSELPDETSPVQFWPHNFDLAVMWLSGRKVPGFEPEHEKSDEQIAFGLSTGDTGTPDAYLYVTVYPWPEKLVEMPLPDGAEWHTQGWKGALLPYARLINSTEADARVSEFFRSVYRMGTALLR
jgi:hypothetical protein